MNFRGNYRSFWKCGVTTSVLVAFCFFKEPMKYVYFFFLLLFFCFVCLFFEQLCKQESNTSSEEHYLYRNSDLAQRQQGKNKKK